jgi:hypothetical protein
MGRFTKIWRSLPALALLGVVAGGISMGPVGRGAEASPSPESAGFARMESEASAAVDAKVDAGLDATLDRRGIVSIASADEDRAAWPAFGARNFAGQPVSNSIDLATLAEPSTRLDPASRADAVSGNQGLDGPDQQSTVEIYSDIASGCTRLEGVNPPTIDCSILAGSRFTQRFRGMGSTNNAGGAGEVVRISLVNPATGMGLTRLDQNGNEVAGPVEAPDFVNARFDFDPENPQITSPGQPISMGLRVDLMQGDAALASAELRLRLHVFPAATDNVVGFVFDDRDGNGRRDLGEPGLAGWQIDLSGAAAPAQTQTDSNGRFAFVGLTSGGYTVSQPVPSGWQATRPTSVPITIMDATLGSIVELSFGDRAGGSQGGVASARIQTDRGCRISGSGASYLIGETMQVYLEAGGLSEAEVSLDRKTAAGTERLLERRRIPGAQAFSFQIGAGDQAGEAELLLSVFRPENGSQNPDASARCGYAVESSAGPSIGVAPMTVDFGATVIGQGANRQVVLRNDGQGELIISSLGIQGGSGSPFQLATVGLDGIRLAPGQSQVVGLSYRPNAQGSHQDFLLVRCNAGNQPTVTVPLYGQTSTGQPASGGYVRTDRGCLETHENPLYFVNDPIQLKLRIDSPLGTQAAARIEDITPDGQTRVIFSRNVAVGTEHTLSGARIVPPVGNEALRLTAQVGYELVRNECSFRVAAGGTRIIGYKYEDQNGNGIWEGCPATPWIPGGEPPVPGWGITLTGPESYSTYTDGNGRYEFVVSSPGNYTVTEEYRAGWRPTRPASVPLQLQCFAGEQVPLVLFGNQQDGSCLPCWPTPGGPVPSPVWPTPTIPPFATATPATATAVIPTITPGGPTLTPGPPTATPMAPPACFAQISPRPSLMNVGERAQFSVGVTGGGAVQSYQWAVTGDVIRDYSESTRQAWSTAQMLAGDYQGQNLSFYWKPEANQRHPQNAGPQARRVSVTITTTAGQCSAEHVLSVERNNTNLSRQADDFYTGNHSTAILTEHTLWHAQYPFSGWSYDGSLFFDFHRQFLNRFNSWRAEFGYPPVGIWDSGTSLPRGVDIDHAARGPFYAIQPKPSWFTLNGLIQRPGNGLPCDTSSGQRRLGDYPSNRTLLGCTATHPWHNTVHTSIGGDMLNPQFSPRDPIFWRWHNFVDVISQERLGIFAAQLADRNPNDQNMPILPTGPDAQDSPPHVVYQVPFRLYRYLDGLESFQVEFDQPVSGVSADDLRVNGQPATSVTNEDNQRFVFSGFPRPGLGKVEVKLVSGGIKNLYNTLFEGETWRYHIVDPSIDEDRDGLLSRDELDIHLTNPIDRDSDDDGLSDGDEVRIYNTRPLMWDSDRDGANDRCEIERGSDPNDPADTAVGCPVSSIFVCFAGNGEAIER